MPGGTGPESQEWLGSCLDCKWYAPLFMIPGHLTHENRNVMVTGFRTNDCYFETLPMVVWDERLAWLHACTEKGVK